MEKYRIRLDNTRMYPRSVFWYVEEYDEKYGWRSVRRGLVSFFGKKAAIRAANRGLKKHKKFKLYNELYDLSGNPLPLAGVSHPIEPRRKAKEKK